MNILGIETSCDETAAAVVEGGRKIRASVVASQVAIHSPYGGVVPELASRKHMENLVWVVEQALAESGMTNREIDGVAVTRGPGLIGALLVGFSFAKAFAYGLKIPWVGVDHLEGHIQTVFLSGTPPAFPFAALLASGGHTGIYHVRSHTEIRCVGQTRDDAAGEAFDKTAKMLGLGYPGGVAISRLATAGDPARIRFPRVYLDKEAFDFSFSGIKTAVKRYVETHCDYRDHLADIAAGFEEAVVDVLSYKLIRAAEVLGCREVAVVGGVAANGRLRRRVAAEAEQRGMVLHVPALDLCGDNAAMIAAAGYRLLSDPNGPRGSLEDDVYSRARLQSPHPAVP